MSYIKDEPMPHVYDCHDGVLSIDGHGIDERWNVERLRIIEKDGRVQFVIWARDPSDGKIRHINVYFNESIKRVAPIY